MDYVNQSIKLSFSFQYNDAKYLIEIDMEV
jgi:hypothetical protein